MSTLSEREQKKLAELWLLGLASAVNAADATKKGPSLIAAMGMMSEIQARALILYISKLKDGSWK